MEELKDYKKVQELTALYKYLDWLLCKVEDTKHEIRTLGANMDPFDIKYAVRESEK